MYLPYIKKILSKYSLPALIIQQKPAGYSETIHCVFTIIRLNASTSRCHMQGTSPTLAKSQKFMIFL